MIVRRSAALVLFALFPAVARADDEICRRTISVTGRAEAARAPDFAEIAVGVEARAPNAAKAMDAASKAVAGVIAAGRDLGVPEKDIGTAAVVLEPVSRTVTGPNGATRDEPDGYRAANRVSLRLADMGRLGDLLRRALDVGVNRIDSVTFGIDDPERAESALQVAAARDARERAAALASAVGATLGPLCSLSTAQGLRPLAYQASRAAPASKRVPIEAGTIAGSAEVAASFAVSP